MRQFTSGFVCAFHSSALGSNLDRPTYVLCFQKQF